MKHSAIFNQLTIAATALLTFSTINVFAKEAKENQISDKPTDTTPLSATPWTKRLKSDYLFTLEVQPNRHQETGAIIPLTPAAINASKDILVRRLIDSGRLNAPVSAQGNRLEIQIKEINLAEATAIQKLLTTTAKLTIHKRHPQSNKLAKLVHAKKELVPGYRAYPQEMTDRDGKIIGTRYVLVTRKPALTGKDIAAAWPDRTTNTLVLIELTANGATKMEDFSRGLAPGKDFIASILDGKVINNAVLNAEVLSKNFLISGLDNLKECEDLAKVISNPLENDIKFISKHPLIAQPERE